MPLEVRLHICDGELAANSLRLRRELASDELISACATRMHYFCFRRRDDMARMIFVNLPVADLAVATRFYEALGCKKNPLSSGGLAKIYGFTDVDGSQPDAWRYLVEVQDAGRPADTTGYR